LATALITGPTAGIGRGFADALAARGLDLVLVARDEDRLIREAGRLSETYGVSCELMVADLSVRADVDRVADRLRTSTVDVLVNNAGFGLRAPFAATEVEDEQRLLDVLVVAVMRLTHAALPGMVSRGRGSIINVSSVAGFIAGGTYSAAKSWVTVFSESLAEQQAGTGVRVVAVCPGFTHTEFHERAGIEMSALPEWLWLDVDDVVEQALRDLARRRPVSIAGAPYKALSGLLQHGPRALARAAAGARSNPRFRRG
jgi:short-subunit dehydrogenase